MRPTAAILLQAIEAGSTEISFPDEAQAQAFQHQILVYVSRLRPGTHPDLESHPRPFFKSYIYTSPLGRPTLKVVARLTPLGCAIVSGLIGIREARQAASTGL